MNIKSASSTNKPLHSQPPPPSTRPPTCFTHLQQPLPCLIQLPPTTSAPPDDDNDVAEPHHQLISACRCDGVGWSGATTVTSNHDHQVSSPAHFPLPLALWTPGQDAVAMAPATTMTSSQLPMPAHRHATCPPPRHRPRQSTATQQWPCHWGWPPGFHRPWPRQWWWQHATLSRWWWQYMSSLSTGAFHCSWPPHLFTWEAGATSSFPNMRQWWTMMSGNDYDGQRPGKHSHPLPSVRQWPIPLTMAQHPTMNGNEHPLSSTRAHPRRWRPASNTTLDKWWWAPTTMDEGPPPPPTNGYEHPAPPSTNGNKPPPPSMTSMNGPKCPTAPSINSEQRWLPPLTNGDQHAPSPWMNGDERCHGHLGPPLPVWPPIPPPSP